MKLNSPSISSKCFSVLLAKNGRFLVGFQPEDFVEREKEHALAGRYCKPEIPDILLFDVVDQVVVQLLGLLNTVVKGGEVFVPVEAVIMT